MKYNGNKAENVKIAYIGGGKNMQNYTIIPLNTEYIEEICQDIKEQYEKNIATCALFIMSLVPEGTPVINKAEIMCEKYDKFRDRLLEMGIECGILVQSSIGHGGKLNEDNPFQKYVSLKDGVDTRNTCCPYDEDFRLHFKEVMKILASHRPKIIMLDDDFRLMERRARGCVCPLHLKRISELVGKEITKEKLLEHTKKTDEESIRITKAFIKTQGEALIGAVKAMREGIDEVDPSLPGVYCTCGNAAEFAAEIAEIIAGAGNPVTVRINNGNYTPQGARGQSEVAFRAAVQKIHLGDRVDVILAETDTCPHNRYSTSAASLHTHFTVSILEGVKGAKHWITRTRDYEPNSGKAYREILSKYSGFYSALSELVPSLSWVGANNFISPAISYGYENEHTKSCSWATCVLERMGIPLFFSSKVSGAVFLDGDDAKNFTDDECIKMLSKTVVMASKSAEIFIKRGYGEHLGVDIKAWNGANPSFERIHINGKKTSVQMKTKQIIPLSDKTKADSTVYHLKGGKEESPIFPGSTVYKNPLGGTVIVFSGTPEAEFTYTQAFSFLCESRKLQLVRLLKDSGNLPVYFEGDEEVYFKAAYMEDKSLFCSVINTGFDPIEQIKLCVEKPVNSVMMLSSDGIWEKCGFTSSGDVITVEKASYTLQPIVLRLL